jgi:hypothetical protein
LISPTSDIECKGILSRQGFGFIVRFQPNFNNNIEVYDVRLENLGFCACQLDIKESKFDYTSQKLCSGE